MHYIWDGIMILANLKKKKNPSIALVVLHVDVSAKVIC